MSNNNLQRHESRDKSKWVVMFIAILLAFVAIAAAFVCIFSDGFTNWDKFKPDEEQTETPSDEGQGDDMALVGGAVIGESVGSGVKLMTARIAPTEFAEYGISPMAETAYTLTATITPSNATNKSVDWSVAFVNPSSAWAKGKTVTDYVTVTPTSDGALTANVECLQAFGDQIKVTVTSRVSDTISAACTVDYAKRIVTARSVWYGSETPRDEYVFDSSDSEYTITSENSIIPTLDFSDDSDYSAYTVNDTFEQTWSIAFSSTAVDVLNDAGFPVRSDATIASCPTFGAASIQFNEGFLRYALDYNSLSSDEQIQLQWGFGDSFNEFVNAGKSLNGATVATLTITFTGEYSVFSYDIDIKMDDELFVLAPSDISLEKSNIIF